MSERGICLVGTIAEATARDVTVRLATDTEIAGLHGRGVEVGLLSTGLSTPADGICAEDVYVRRSGGFVKAGMVVECHYTADRYDVSTHGSSSPQSAPGLIRWRFTVEGFVHGGM